LGSTIALTDNSGSITDKYAYDDFGRIVNQVGTSENPFKYVGRYGVMDEGNGLYFMRARYYDATVGRFLQKDPIGFEGGINLYVYVGNNSVNWIDPLGLWTLLVDVSANRNNVGTWTLVDEHGDFIAQDHVLARGSATNHTNRLVTDADTPTGTYSFGGFMPVIHHESYGNANIIVLNPIAGEALEAKKQGRDRFRMHEGHPEDRKNVAWQNPYNLRPTNGCLRTTPEGQNLLNSSIINLSQKGDINGTIRVDEGIKPLRF